MARSQADVFLEAILENPDDDTPRLVYADWLEERGDPASVARAEFIRVQCALARERLQAGRRFELVQREWDFLMQYADEWAQPIRRLALRWEFHRGFVDEVVMWADKFLSGAGRLFRRAPVQHVRLWRENAPPPRRPYNLPALAESIYLRRLRSLDLSGSELGSDEVRVLTVSEHMTNLTGLNLAYNRIGDRGIRALAEAPLLSRLMDLDLRHNRFGAPGLRTLAEALERLACGPEGLRLRRVILDGNPLGNAGRRLIKGSPLLRRVARPSTHT